MRTVPVKSGRKIAVVTERSESLREIVFQNPLIYRPPSTWMHLFSVFIATTVFMVQCQKLVPCFSATSTFPSVVIQHLAFPLQISFLAIFSFAILAGSYWCSWERCLSAIQVEIGNWFSLLTCK